MSQTFIIKLFVKNNHVYVIGHDHICVYAKSFFPDAISQAIYNDLCRFWVDKNRQPINDGKGDKIDIYPVHEFEAIHESIIVHVKPETCRANSAHGGDTGAIRHRRGLFGPVETHLLFASDVFLNSNTGNGTIGSRDYSLLNM
jgi:hypothetical protein